MNGGSLRESVVRLKRDLFEMILGIGILALGLVVILFTFSQAFGPVYAPPPVLLTISGSAGMTPDISV